MKLRPKSCVGGTTNSAGLLQIARPSVSVWSVLAQPLEPPYTDPYVRWCGRGGAERLPLSRSLNP
jgi:hypothetical protein